MKYTAPLFLFNAHLETIYPSLIRKVLLRPYRRERIVTNDNDFLDLDWLDQHSSKLVIISHGLEGSSERPYIKGLARALFNAGFDVLAWNFRGCSGEINRQLRFYHSGASDDLHRVVQHVLEQKKYAALYLTGFSLGGNLTLKYAGEQNLAPEIKKIVTFSVPLNLQTSCAKISSPANWVYANRFLKSLKNKIILKSKAYPELDTKLLGQIKTIQTFDDQYTAPIHGFKNAATYYDQCSALRFIKNIRVPTLIINALNDPFLSPECFPAELLKAHGFVRLEMPIRGGHVGFAQFSKSGLYWSEERALYFINNEGVS